MISKILNILLVVVVLALIGNYVYRMPKFGDGEAAPAFSTTLVDGTPFELKNLKGSYALLDFWGSWCAPCRRENPKLVELKKQFENTTFSDANGFEIVSIAVERDAARHKKAVQDDGLYWKYHIAQLERFKSPIVIQYGVKEIPTKYLIDPKGNIISVNDSVEEITAYLNSKKK